MTEHEKHLWIKKSIITISLTSAILISACIIICLFSINIRQKQNQMHTTPLCITTTTTMLIIDITFDKEPIDVNLVLPDNTTYEPLQITYNNGTYMKTQHTIHIEFFAKNIGSYYLQYNTKRNTDIQISYTTSKR